MTTATAHSSSLSRVSLTEALALGPDAWDRLLARSEAPGAFLDWAWHRACADALPADDLRTCQAIVLRSASGELQGVVPFRVQPDRFWGPPIPAIEWSFGDLGCPDHRDLLASPDADLDALAGVLEHLPWVVMRLDHVTEGVSNAARFCAACERRGWTVQRQPQGRCLYVDLPESWDAYLAPLSAHRRHAIRRNERKLRREHDVVLTEYGRERLEEGLQHLERLHAMRWSGGGVFHDIAMQRLHRSFAAALAERGRLCLVTLDIDGSPAAAWYGFSHGDTIYHYQSGRDPQWERERVGSVLVGLMIRRAIERGFRRFDFLRGEEPYKTEWTTTARSNYQIIIFRAGWRGALLRGLDWLERPLRGRGLRRPIYRLYHVLTAPLGF